MIPSAAEGRGAGEDRLHTVFVYGTLRPGMANAAVARHAKLVAHAPATAAGLELYHLEPEGYPAAVRARGGDPPTVHGAVLRVRDLAPLDALEGIHDDPPLYHRVRWPVRIRAPLGSETAAGTTGERPEDGGVGEAWIYLYVDLDRLGRPGARRVESGRWRPTASTRSKASRTR